MTTGHCECECVYRCCSVLRVADIVQAIGIVVVSDLLYLGRLFDRVDPKSRLFDRVDPIKPVSNVHLCIRSYVRPSTKSFFDFSEIWHVCRSRSVMHDGMQYDLIQGQGHEAFIVGNLDIFKSYLLRHL